MFVWLWRWRPSVTDNFLAGRSKISAKPTPARSSDRPARYRSLLLTFAPPFSSQHHLPDRTNKKVPINGNIFIVCGVYCLTLEPVSIQTRVILPMGWWICGGYERQKSLRLNKIGVSVIWLEPIYYLNKKSPTSREFVGTFSWG